jgi:hypothetical protein
VGLTKRLLESEFSNLPPEAYDQFFDIDGPFNPDNNWLKSASPEDQKIAVKTWFLNRYCDPAMETPYNHEDGYIYINGGPYDPAEEISNRFEGLIDEQLINEVVRELYLEGGDEWAPISYERDDDYDYRFSLALHEAGEPLRRLQERLQQASQVLELQGDSEAMLMAERLVFGAAITTLESFLWETADYWVESDEGILRNFVTKIPALRDQTILLGDIFERHSGLKEFVKGYLQNVMWHNWKKVGPIYKDGLGVEIGSIKIIDESLVKRHDIIHRSGNDKNGNPISVSKDEISLLHKTIEGLAKRIDAQLLDRSTRPL